MVRASFIRRPHRAARRTVRVGSTLDFGPLPRARAGRLRLRDEDQYVTSFLSRPLFIGEGLPVLTGSGVQVPYDLALSQRHFSNNHLIPSIASSSGIEESILPFAYP